MSDIGKSARDAAAARNGDHLMLMRGNASDGTLELVGCTCGFRCMTNHPDQEFAWHIATTRTAGTPSKDSQ